MNINHALLDALGVGHPQLSRLVLAARSAGAFGARLPGPVAGAAWWPSAQSRSSTGLLRQSQSCDARAIVTGIDTEGARKEKNV